MPVPGGRMCATVQKFRAATRNLRLTNARAVVMLGFPWGNSVGRYLFILHINGDDAAPAEMECGDDAEALLTALHLTEICDVDVWAEERVIGSLQRPAYTAKAS